MKQLFLFFLLLFLPGLALAQLPDPPAPAGRATIAGYVKDAANGEGIIGVSVYVKERGTGTTTNNYGYYALSLAPGRYTLVFSFIGYEKITRTVD
ncbi:MAG: carboxypeptidase-like regulatory domain-containing protein, partial [Sphingobacteriaceae bacterium]|nr:carboxypeptidase-like regulatory domain-containing protein [Cytophagaceae bacterium]